MKNLFILFFACTTMFSIEPVTAQEGKDTIHTSLSLNYGGGGSFNRFYNYNFSQRINPSFNFKYKKFELGLGLDYDGRFYSYNNIKGNYQFLGFVPSLRRYFGKSEFLFGEIYSNIGYTTSQWSTYYPGGGYAYAGVGIGARFHPEGFNKSTLLKKIDINGYIRQPLISTLAQKSTDIKLGISYRF